MIEAFWWKEDGENFGDVLTPLLLKLLSGQDVHYSEDEGALVSIGSVAGLAYKSRKFLW